MKIIISACLLMLGTGSLHAGDLTTDAAIGGGLGGAIGGAVGAELGGREGATIGSAAGAAFGTAIATEGDQRRHRDRDHYRRYEFVPYDGGHPHSRFCPPGQAKKGRC